MADRRSEKSRKSKVSWPLETECRLTEVWNEITSQCNGKMVSIKPKKLKQPLNCTCTLRTTFVFVRTRDEVHNKIDNILQKAKRFYVTYKKGDADKEAYGNSIAVDVDAAVLEWQDFSVFFNLFKDHPSLGPGNADDSAFIEEDSQLCHIR